MMNQEDDYQYALKCIFNAHADMVSAVTSTSIPGHGILTGSFDNTVKHWSPIRNTFKECHKFTPLPTFITSLCVLPESSRYPKGLILAGSNDCSIYGFIPGFGPVLRLLGHSGIVTSLSYIKEDYFISGSWDCTARVWSGKYCISTLQGHLKSVWATAAFPTQNRLLTGSADHTIRLWCLESCEKIFKGHEDCVMGLSVISDEKFLSCSKDTTIRLWLTNGECMNVFKSHTNSVHSITLLSNGIDFATCGGDQKVKIWKKGVCSQTVVLSKSLWSITCLSNGDLAIGTSDGKVYVFEKVPENYFETMAILNEVTPNGSSTNTMALSESNVALEFSDIKSSMYNGELVVFYDHGRSIKYECDYNHGNVTMVKKEVFDLQKRPPKASTSYISAKKVDKKDHVQKDYVQKDYVMKLNFENTLYKLAFNTGENPWDIISNLNIDHNHVGRIVDFIVKKNGYSPPYPNQYFPVKTFYTHNDDLEEQTLRAKLLEFCEKVQKENYVSPAEIDELMKLAEFPEELTTEQLSSLDKAIFWNDEFLSPVLDLLRLGVKCKGLQSKISSNDFMNRLLGIYMNTNKTVNKVLIQKIICNMFGNIEVEDILSFFQEKIYEAVKEQFSTGEEAIQKTGSALFLNFAIAAYKGFNLNVESFCSHVVDVFKHVKDPEAIFRMLVAVGTICAIDSFAISYFRSVYLSDFILKFKFSTEDPKIEKVVELLYQYI